MLSAIHKLERYRFVLNEIILNRKLSQTIITIHRLLLYIDVFFRISQSYYLFSFYIMCTLLYDSCAYDFDICRYDEIPQQLFLYFMSLFYSVVKF